MGISYQFMEDQKYSAEDVNTAFSRLVTKGVSYYKERASLISMEEARANMPGSTVEERCALLNTDACLVKKNGERFSVSPGTIYFENGASAVIGNEGHELSVDLGTAQYVYAQWNGVQDRAEIVVSAQEGPESSVTLAKIEPDGNIVDWREFARPRGIPAGGNIIQTRTVSFSLSGSDHDEDKVRARITLPFGGFNIVFLKFEESEEIKICLLNKHEKSVFLGLLSNMPQIAFQKSGTELLIYGHCINKYQDVKIYLTLL